jgi:hypothetical protein
LIDPTPYGNPFSHLPISKALFPVKTRKEAIIAFEHYFYSNPELQTLVQKNLRDKVLGCHCKPKSCHGDVYVKFLSSSLTKYF